jgi:hypothetical protein
VAAFAIKTDLSNKIGDCIEKKQKNVDADGTAQTIDSNRVVLKLL